jgi:gas vesicle protein
MGGSSDGGGALTVVGLLFGAALGAAVGLVYSPSTGIENRKRLVSWASGRATELRDKVQAQAQQLGNKAKDNLSIG